MVKLSWTSEAQRWLKDIHDYIAQDNPEAADRMIQVIYNKAQTLRNFPKQGYLYRKHKDKDKEVRVLMYGHYRIAYVIKADDTIDILGVFHGALDIDRYLL